jgi:hypothetical protein
MNWGSWKHLTGGAAAAALFALSGCAELPRYADETGSGYDPRYGGYWSADPREDAYEDAYEDAPPEPEYLAWPEYYSVLWPVYQYYYDPWYNPGFYYGVTYFPSTWFGLGYADPYAWPYYVPYSPYIYSPWDNYYVWYGGGNHHHHGRGGHHHGDHDGDDEGHGHHHHGDHHDGDGYAHDGGRHGDHHPGSGNGTPPRFGSGVNQAQRLAELSAPQRMRGEPTRRLRQNRPGSAGFPDAPTADGGAPAPGKGTPDPRTKPRATSGPGWAAPRAYERDAARMTQRGTPRTSYPAADDELVRAEPRASRPARVDRDPRTYRRPDARDDPRSSWLGAAPGARAVEPDGRITPDASEAEATPANGRASYRDYAPGSSAQPAPGAEYRARRDAAPRPTERVYVERMPHSPDAAATGGGGNGIVPYAGASRGSPPPYAAAPRTPAAPYGAPASPSSAPAPARAPDRPSIDRSGVDDARGGASRERDR